MGEPLRVGPKSGWNRTARSTGAREIALADKSVKSKVTTAGKGDRILDRLTDEALSICYVAAVPLTGGGGLGCCGGGPQYPRRTASPPSRCRRERLFSSSWSRRRRGPPRQ